MRSFGSEQATARTTISGESMRVTDSARFIVVRSRFFVHGS
jgi:hypothetical protein